MSWVGRLFDARDTLARMLLLDLSGVGYLVVGVHGRPGPTATQWAFALAAFAVALLCHRRPLLNLLLQCALLVAALPLVDDSLINQVGASWALLELTMRATRPRTFWLAAGLLAAIDVSDLVGDPVRKVLTGVFGLAVTVGLPVLLGLVVRTTRELGRQAEERAAAEQRRRESESRAARADERSAIARELHDVLAHHVASMVLRVGVARHVLPDLDPRVGAVFDDVHGTGTAALADLRRLVAVLRQPDGVRDDAALTAIEPSALPAALGATVDRARQAGITVEADVDPAVGTLDAVRGQAVLRLTQEALTNVAKHAGAAARARLTVSVVDGAVHWAVADDGRGAAPAVVPAGGGHGIVGMRERVEVLGGRLEAGPTGDGWRVRTVLPAGNGADRPAPRSGPAAPEPA
ncbi:histidine kinase [Micromonospora sp. WMMD1128]|uniref:sensor histidine kinase n=1 Tax=unclassified Micromonospora TaxID=2617518 RepID=UPI00248BA025|nr:MULTISPECIES: histidine kinase [unclassified Micromonospora]WBB76414.1 histidine kinase [Micromonospora sp. WMMD1128]WFE35800.1 histidine kinase [Micromonospora sp. WMMD975]